MFNSSTTDDDDDITHSNADWSYEIDSNGMDTCLNLDEKSRCVLVCPEQDGTDDQEIENYYDGFCHVTSPITYILQTAEEKIRETMIGSDFIPERGVIHFWRVEGKKDLAHFVLRPLPHLDWGIGEDLKLGSYEGPLLALVEKRWPKNKGDKVMCVVEKATLIMDELEEYMSTVAENPDRIVTADGLYAIVSNDEGSHLAYHIACASRGKGSKSLSSLGVCVKGSFICWIKNPKASALKQEHLVMEGTKVLLIRGNPKSEKVKEDNSEENLSDAEHAAGFEKELIELDYAGPNIAPLEDDHPIFELFEAYSTYQGSPL
ncbi:hypothetical protein BCON_0378g00020 [Botryotinia convoluta]|uniref:Uncharacterized protein n=1 Tax=Botryotinia convoluta TaxID=54673 RepID=A0A4Z1HBI5_9HELO|nr:hypothetical protein BCON_0378g00020 [Botryotinia convoluta]